MLHVGRHVQLEREGEVGVHLEHCLDVDDGRDNEYEEEEEEESDEELRGVNKLLASAHDPEPAIGYVTKREATKRQIVATGNVARKIFKRAKKKGAKVIFMNI